jgi:uncharacterized protein
MDSGLNAEDITQIQSVFSRYENIVEVKLYGSRAMGNFKTFSDIDLTLIGENIDSTQLNEIDTLLDELNLPYKFDVSIFNQINNQEFLNHISRVGKTVYKSP